MLALTGSFFMLEVYDRIIPSHSVPTLVWLSVLVATLYAFQFALELVRTRILVRIAGVLDHSLCMPVFDAVLRMPLVSRGSGDSTLPLRDLDYVRSFLSGNGPVALFDFPWIPFYLAICFLFHVWIGVAALVGSLILIALTLLTEVLVRAPGRAAMELGASRFALAEEGRRNAEALHAMGMRGRIATTWDNVNARYMASQRRTSDVATALGSLSKTFRIGLQSGIMAIGAYLVIEQQATAGIIVAASILTARALAPIEIAIANWKGFLSARESWHRLEALLVAMPAQVATLPLPRPNESLTVENLTVVPPGARQAAADGVSFALKAGSGLAIVGPNGSGKSSLLRAIVGAWTPVRGVVRLDRIDIRQWNSDILGRHIGYLPQDVELLSGTIAQNIARFEPDADPDKIVTAAKAAGVHGMIAGLSDGYNMDVGHSGTALSAGQRQRIGLARALYGDPFLVALDEPMANLDADGIQALIQAIAGMRSRGQIVIMVAHGPAALTNIDLLLVMGNGRVTAFGPKDVVLTRGERKPAPVAMPLRVVPEGGGTSS